MRSIVIFLMLLSFLACKDDSRRENPEVPSVSNVTYNAANGAVLFCWDNPGIDDLAYVEISYTDRNAKVHRSLTKGGLNQQWIEGIGDNQPYYFRFLVYNKSGEHSAPVDVMAAALEPSVNLFYGRVKLGVAMRGINVSWENEYNENFYIKLAYTDLNGSSFAEEIVAGAYTTGTQLVQIGSAVTGTQTLDVLATIVDENGNESDSKTIKFYKKEVGKLSRTNWAVVSFSSQEADAPVTSILDGNTATIWHTRWTSNKANYPHWAILDLSNKKHLEKIGLQQRPESGSMLKGVALYGNNISGAPATESLWNLIHTFDMTESKAEQLFEFPDPVEYRYIKLVFTTPSFQPNADPECASCAEMNLYGSDIVDQ